MGGLPAPVVVLGRGTDAWHCMDTLSCFDCLVLFPPVVLPPAPEWPCHDLLATMCRHSHGRHHRQALRHSRLPPPPPPPSSVPSLFRPNSFFLTTITTHYNHNATQIHPPLVSTHRLTAFARPQNGEAHFSPLPPRRSWPQIPGRGEYVRLAFEYAQVPYEENNDVKSLEKILQQRGAEGKSPHHFALPVLEIEGGNDDDEEEEGKGGRAKASRKAKGDDAASSSSSSAKSTHQYLSQTPSILLYLSHVLPTFKPPTGGQDVGLSYVHMHQVLLTVLDLSNEIHDTHHPIGSGLYYEEQKDEAKRRAEDLRNVRLPKFLGYFDELLAAEGKSNSKEPRLAIEGKTTLADLALWQVLEGLGFAFPRWMRSVKEGEKKRYSNLWKFQESIAAEPTIKAYVESGRRKPFSDGLFRHYPELDAEAE